MAAGTESVILMSLGQMFDTALGISHPGVIHLDLLYYGLVAIIQELKLTNTRVQIPLTKTQDLSQYSIRGVDKSQSKTWGKRKSSVYSNRSSKSVEKASPKLPAVKEEADGKDDQSNILKDESPTMEKHSLVESFTSELEQSKNPDLDYEPRPKLSRKEEGIIVLDSDENPIEHTVAITVSQMQALFDTVDDQQRQITDIVAELDIQKQHTKTGDESRRKNKDDLSGSIPKDTRSDRMEEGLSSTNNKRPGATLVQILELSNRVDNVEKQLETLEKVSPSSEKTAPNVTKVQSLSDLQGFISNPNAAIQILASELKKLKDLVLGADENAECEETNIHTKVLTIEVRVKQAIDQVEALNHVTAERLEQITDRCVALEEIVFKMENTYKELVERHDYPIISLTEKFDKIEDLVHSIAVRHQRVLDEEIDRKLKMSSLIEQIKFLKITKVDKEEFEFALVGKVGVEQIERKISEDKFETTCNILKNNIMDTVNKLQEQEELWEKALIDLQSELVTKLPKQEMDSLQIYVKDRLRLLQLKIKNIKVHQKEQVASATKNQLIKNVKCLSCDADVNMRKNVSPQNYPMSPRLPPGKTIAPYLSYELDVLRKQQRGLAAGRNLNHFETILHQKGTRTENRYCGGQHTLTTPVQRVTRVGNFLEQWGPELVPVETKMVDGIKYVACENKQLEERSEREIRSVLPEKENSVLKTSRSRDSEKNETPRESGSEGLPQINHKRHLQTSKKPEPQRKLTISEDLDYIKDFK